jgi:hypothetical protein
MDMHTSSAAVCAWCNRALTHASAGPLSPVVICQECADWAFSHQPIEFGVLVDADHIDLPPREPIHVTKH